MLLLALPRLWRCVDLGLKAFFLSVVTLQHLTNSTWFAPLQQPWNAYWGLDSPSSAALGQEQGWQEPPSQLRLRLRTKTKRETKPTLVASR